MNHTTRISIVRLAGAFALAASLGLAGSAAAAQGNLSSRVDGTVTSGQGTFDGSLVVARFEVRGDRLVAIGTLDGTVTGADGKASEMPERDVVLSVQRESLAATCEQARVRLQGAPVEAAGTQVELQPVELEIGAGRNARLRESLCELSRLLANAADPGVVGKQLGTVLSALE